MFESYAILIILIKLIGAELVEMLTASIEGMFSAQPLPQIMPVVIVFRGVSQKFSGTKKLVLDYEGVGS